MSFFIAPAFAAEAAPVAGVASSSVSNSASAEELPYQLSPEKMMFDNFFLLGVLFFIFYFVLIRPQQKRVRQHVEMIKALKKGDKVITSGGIIGVIVKFEGDEVVVVEVAQNVRIRLAKSSISELADDKVINSSNANDN